MTLKETTNGADILVQELIAKEVDVIFCITGAGNLAIIDAIVREGSIKVVYSHHEQAAVMEAQGYSRVSGKTGLALVTTGGGAANSLTGILSAYLDSIPVVIISGNESSFHCDNIASLRAYGVQGFDSVTTFRPVTKATKRIADALDIIVDFNGLWDEANRHRRGPVFLDFPMDLQRKIIQRRKCHLNSVQSINTTGQSVVDEISNLTDLLKTEIRSASRPLIYIGNGCRGTGELLELTKFVKDNNLPYCLSWSAADLFPADDELNMGHIGIYGDRASNIALQKCDLLISIGNRLAIPQIGYDKSDFARKAKKWVVEIDPTECSKFADTDWRILNISTSDFLKSINSGSEIKVNSDGREKWLTELKILWAALPRINQVGPMFDELPNVIHSAKVVDYLNSNLESDAIIVTDVGAGLLTGHYLFEPQGTQRLFTSQGLGEMGFGLPGAIGAHFADPERQLICLNTDGGIMFNLQELQLISEHDIPLKLFVFNNNGYSMIKISQQNLFSGRMSGSGPESGVSFPNFSDIAAAFKVKHVSIQSVEDLDAKLKPALNSKQAMFIEIMMPTEQRYLPRLSTTKLDNGTLISPPLEDLDPLLPIGELEEYLGYKAHENSYKAREIQYGQN